MTAMNYGRPRFVQQALRTKYGGPSRYVDPDPRPTRTDSDLKAYSGQDPTLCALRSKVLNGAVLTAKENGIAGDLLSHLLRCGRAERLLAESTDNAEVIQRLRSSFGAGVELSRRDVSDLQVHLKLRGQRL